MVVRGAAYRLAAYSPVPSVELRFRLLRDGEVTSSAKVLRFYRDWESLDAPQLVFVLEAGEFTSFQRVGLAALQALEWTCIGRDDQPPRRVRAAYLSLSTGGTYTFNITSGDGGQAGEPAQVEARVRVERVPSSREVVLLERPPDGEWRVAGYGPTPGGTGEIDLRVVGGDVYALAVDDYGVQFVADLAVQVGQRIRPTQYTGWVYEITEAGQLPSVEPAWWAAVGENPSQPLGSARAVARRYFQPIALGPGPVEVI
jgi:hypothetical protein